MINIGEIVMAAKTKKKDEEVVVKGDSKRDIFLKDLCRLANERDNAIQNKAQIEKALEQVSNQVLSYGIAIEQTKYLSSVMGFEFGEDEIQKIRAELREKESDHAP